MYVYIVHVYNLAKIFSKNAKVEMEKNWNITYKKMTNEQIQKKMMKITNIQT